MARKRSRQVADHIERCYDEQRMVIEARGALILLAALKSLPEADGGEKKQRGREQIPRAGDKAGYVSEWSGRRRQKSCARKISSDGNDQQRTGGFFAGLPRRRDVPFHGDGGEQENGKYRAANHPAHRDLGEGCRPRLKHIVQAKIADRLNNSRQYEA